MILVSLGNTKPYKQAILSFVFILKKIVLEQKKRIIQIGLSFLKCSYIPIWVSLELVQDQFFICGTLLGVHSHDAILFVGEMAW